jgi:hypothetical protein
MVAIRRQSPFGTPIIGIDMNWTYQYELLESDPKS